ncbi:MAG: ATP-binding cassette domain-containing protein, partial [Actinobacteria bacterium]|nr:ATP-binding cassette domain-containing protein [Actinomycetota bacterium]
MTAGSGLVVAGLRASVDGHEILRGIDLEVTPGRVEVIMGPNGSGKSTLANVIMGHPAYAVTAGDVTLDGDSLLGLPTHERAARGLF